VGPGDQAERILLVLERREDRDRGKDALSQEGWKVFTRDSPIGATVEIVRSRIDVVVVDVDFDVMSGDRFAELVRRNDRLDHVAIILVARGATLEAQALADRVGADGGIGRGNLAAGLSNAILRGLSQRRRMSSRPPPALEERPILVLRSDRFAMPLVEGRQLIGRDTTCRFVLNHRSVSRQHAAIEVHGAQATIEDLGSHNGTHVNDVRLTAPRPLELGDTIRIGEETLVLGIRTQVSRETIEVEDSSR
jgi:CheY-like chemotaxis protein